VAVLHDQLLLGIRSRVRSRLFEPIALDLEKAVPTPFDRTTPSHLID
jgi:hypothetical protein